MMKILLIFTLSLISGPVGCVVTGYTGGSIVIISDLKWGSGFSKYICKLGSISCTDIIRTDTTENSVQEGRFKLYKNSNRFLRVLIRRLKPQDTGVYRIGVEDQTPINMKLTVLNDSCCDQPKTVNVFPGLNISIISNYPVIYNRDFKYIMKLENGSVLYDILDTFEKSQNNRFSIFDDKSAKVLGMNISNVTEADDGVYLYGIFNRKNSIKYYSFFREIHLQVREPSSANIIIISVCVILVLLLICGFALMVYKLIHMRTEVTGPPPSAKDSAQVPPVPRIYEEVNQTKHVSATDTELYMNAPSQSPNREIISTVEPPQHQQPEEEKNLTYTSVSFPKNPDDAAITFSKEESTEYATVQRTSKL
ncbi:uncharacterized protein LOC132862578 [Tachysurus vachellii]|uniref:uncharacterized protein LOC132862578 n=1 Tax=Tachysurus vachellii TaxID=175792 RepID=UPI00296AB77E|nr:uncharacterized protein LOC132862578 [Tachysurus vachellii]